jgi:glycosyltransferase involved in cell wall biosynthesis
MLAGKPILASNNLIKDPVELSGCGIVVKPDSSASIREGINQFYQMTDSERMVIGQKGADYVRKYHDMSFLASQYMKLFDRLSNRKCN